MISTTQPEPLGPKVTVIVPVYNVASYLEASIGSLLNQSHANWEAIFVNDGSTDDSQAVIERFALRDQRIRIITQRNAGAGAARNRGLEEAAGDYVYFLDPDDLVDPNLLSDNIQIMSENSLDIVTFRYRRAFPDGIVLTGKQATGAVAFYVNQDEIRQGVEKLHFQYRMLYMVWNKLYSLNFIKRAAARFPNHRTGEDSLFNIDLLRHCHRMALNDCFYYTQRMQRPGSLTTNNLEQFIDDKRVGQELWRLFDIIELKGRSRDSIIRTYLSLKKCAIFSASNGGYGLYKSLQRKYGYQQHVDMRDGLGSLCSKTTIQYALVMNPWLIYLLARTNLLPR